MEPKKIVFRKKRRERLDDFLSSGESIHSRSFALRLIKKGNVKVNGEKITKGGLLLMEGDQVEYQLEQGEVTHIKGEDIPLDIIFENRNFLVLNKPAGIVVHPGAGNVEGTLSAGIINYLGGVPEHLDPVRPGIVHRLDKDTSGVIVIAKNAKIHAYLSDLFKSRKTKKVYKTLVYGKVEEGGRVESLIGRHKTKRKKMAVTDAESRGKKAVTLYEVDEIYKLSADSDQYCTLLTVKIKTGRTHQIRVHMKEIGHPVVGDKTYAGRKMMKRYPPAKRQLLHAFRLEFESSDGRKMKFTSPVPADFQNYIKNDFDKY